jgi:pimeloyl-ACP methyl ester carboxylesterase
MANAIGACHQERHDKSMALFTMFFRPFFAALGARSAIPWVRGLPTMVLWQEFDPIFPREWSDRLDEFFTDVSLEMLDGAGHFTPLQAPAQLAHAIKKRLTSSAS